MGTVGKLQRCTVFISVVALAVIAIGCSEEISGAVPVWFGTGQGGGNGGSDEGTTAGSGSGGAPGGSVSTGEGSTAYCALQQTLRARCLGCHSNPPVGGAPMPLVTYSDLLAPARSNPSRTVVEIALERMQDPVRPMPPPPAPRATAAEVGTLTNWIAAGSPVVCVPPPPGSTTSTTGAGGAGPIDAGSIPPSGTGGADGGGNLVDGGASTALCDLQQTLRARCLGCHSNPPVGGAPMPLVTYADLVAPARSNPSTTVAALALVRMQDPVSPMPPAPAPRATPAEVSTLSKWLAAGSPSTCVSSPPTGGDGGPTGNPPPPPPPPVVCTSGQHWTSGDTGSALMHPGGTCITCHASQDDAPRYTIAGTVYPTIREPTDCNGSNGTSAGIQVVVTDAAGRVLTLPVNTVGNFFTTAAVTFPFHAKVVRGTVERVMTAAQSTGNCNGCHTEAGANGAPGRIVAP